MIFCRTKVDAKSLADELNSRGYPSDSMHGDMSQQQRDITMKNFKNKKIKMLVCTDVAARGIDVDNLTHVINFGLPQDIESYVHRIGRTGRAGQTGVAITIIEPSERYRLRQVENNTKALIPKATLPTTNDLKDVLVKKELRQFDKLIEDMATLEANQVFSEKFDALSKEDLLKVVYNHLFKAQIDRYESRPSLEVQERRPEPRSQDGRFGGNSDNRRSDAPQGRPGNAGNVRFFVNVGREHGVTLHVLLRSIAGMVNVDERMIRNVDLKESFSFLEVPEKYSDALLRMNGPMINERKVRFELTKSAPTERPHYRDRKPSVREKSFRS
jgi:ATP-dependent RNA helicase DeaD